MTSQLTCTTTTTSTTTTNTSRSSSSSSSSSYGQEDDGDVSSLQTTKSNAVGNTPSYPNTRTDDDRHTHPHPASKKRKQNLTEEGRRERNEREQARSNRLSQQIEEMRDLLTVAGVVVPRATKGAVLAATVQHMRALQEQHDQVQRYVSVS